MTDRNEIKRELKESLAKGEFELKKLQAKLEAAGDKATDEAKAAYRSAAAAFEKGKAKAKQLAEATDDEFDKLWAESKSDLHELKAHMENGWTKFTHSVRDFFA